MAIWSILRTFGIFFGYLVYFTPFWQVLPREIWQPWSSDCPVKADLELSL
jgi:hypothetical protein